MTDPEDRDVNHVLGHEIHHIPPDQATKSAGQLLYEKDTKGIICPTPRHWALLGDKARAKYEFNALVVPKAQTLKLP